MPTDADPDLRLRGRLLRSLGQLREMLPGSFVERNVPVGGPTAIARTAKTCIPNIKSPYWSMARPRLSISLLL